MSTRTPRHENLPQALLYAVGACGTGGLPTARETRLRGVKRLLAAATVVGATVGLGIIQENTAVTDEVVACTQDALGNPQDHPIGDVYGAAADCLDETNRDVTSVELDRIVATILD